MNRVESSNIQIESFGGTGGYITGSCHKITFSKEGVNGRASGHGEDNSILLDVGLWQGRFEERSGRGERRNFEPMKNIAIGITDILTSHVHIDHVGRLPIVYKDGFTPRILATKATAEFMRPVLENSAEIQESKILQERLYTNWDVEKAIRHIKPVEPFTMIDIGKKHSNITAEFDINGHIMGSSSIVITDHRSNKSVLFTGDMGKPNQALGGGYQEYAGRYSKTPVDMLVIESTSFDKEPISFEEKKKSFLNVVYETWAGGGNPLFPMLSLQRTPEMMELIHNCQESGDLPDDFKMIIDAPYAINKLLAVHLENLSRGYGDNPGFYKTEEESRARFDIKDMIVVDSHKQSASMDKEMAHYSGKAIILASGGMGNFGRSQNYIHGDFGKNALNSIIFNCFQVPGTEGNQLLKGESPRYKKTGAKILRIEGFTGHASGVEIIDYLKNFNLTKLKGIIITHGRDTARNSMAEYFKETGFDGRIVLSDLKEKIIC